MNALKMFFRVLRIAWKLGIWRSLDQVIGILKSEMLRVDRTYSDSPPSIPRREPDSKPKDPPQGSLSVLILNGFQEHEALYRYRVKQKIDQLGSVGVKVDTIHFNAPNLVTMALNYTHLILYRLPLTKPIEQLAAKAKTNGIKLIFDIDDLIFDLKICQEIDGIQILNDQEKEEFLLNMSRVKAALKLCGYGLVTTTPLKAKLEEMGLKTYVHRNGFETEMLEIADRAIRGKMDKNGVAISYLSGSHTHNRDFHLCVDALVNVLKKYDNVKLYIFGWLNVSDRLEPFQSKIVHIPFMPWKELVLFTKDMDINLSPLEDNGFCHCKSELKYLETAILGIPTIASPRPAFTETITHGVNGYLAETTEEWSQCLEHLITHSEIRKTMGFRAREHVLREYNIEKMGRNLADFLSSL